MEERKSFYIGVKLCGCITASMVDDDKTTAKDVADFANNMHKTGRKIKHAELTEAEFMAALKRCQCQPSNASFSRGPSGPSAGSDS